MKATNALLGIIAILLGVIAYFSYLSALTFGPVPYLKLSGEQQLACAEAVSSCPMEWHLKGTNQRSM